MSTNWIIIYLGLAAILLELIIGIQAGFDLVLIGIALMIGGGVGLAMDNTTAGIIVAGILSVAYIFFGRQLVKKRLINQIQHSNTESIIGKHGHVTKKITPKKAGQIMVDTETWRAVSDKTLDIDTQITVTKVTGVTAHVVEYRQ